MNTCKRCCIVSLHLVLRVIEAFQRKRERENSQMHIHACTFEHYLWELLSVWVWYLHMYVLCSMCSLCQKLCQVVAILFYMTILSNAVSVTCHHKELNLLSWKSKLFKCIGRLAKKSLRDEKCCIHWILRVRPIE